jgi:hypothetical protein
MPGKFSPELADQWVKAYQELGAVSFACDAVGISKVSFYDWMHRGERGEEPYQEFYYSARRARAKKAGKLIQIVEGDKGGAAFLLGALFPAEFGQSGRAGRDAMQTLLDAVWPHLSDGARGEFLSAITAIERQRAGISEPGVADGEEAGTGSEVIDAVGESVGELPASTEPHR